MEVTCIIRETLRIRISSDNTLTTGIRAVYANRIIQAPLIPQLIFLKQICLDLGFQSGIRIKRAMRQHEKETPLNVYIQEALNFSMLA